MIITNKDFSVEEYDGFVSFDGAFPTNDIEDVLSRLITFDQEKKANVVFKLKGLGVDKLAIILRYFITRKDYVNVGIMTNILIFMRNYNSLDDSFFESENVYVSSLEEFIDLKLALKPDIRKLNKELAVLFISCFKSSNKFEYNFTTEPPLEVQPFMRACLFSMDIFLLSSILMNCDQFDSSEFFFVKDALTYVMEFSAKTNGIDGLFKIIGGNG